MQEEEEAEGVRVAENDGISPFAQICTSSKRICALLSC